MKPKKWSLIDPLVLHFNPHLQQLFTQKKKKKTNGKIAVVVTF